MTSVHRITVQKESKYLFFITESLSVSDTRREEKSQMETLEAEKRRASGLGKPDFSQKEASIWPKRRKHSPKMSLCFGNISYCFPKYLLLLFQIRSERDTPSSGWQPQAELSEVTKKIGMQSHPKHFHHRHDFFLSLYVPSIKNPKIYVIGKNLQNAFFPPRKHPVRNKRF